MENTFEKSDNYVVVVAKQNNNNNCSENKDKTTRYKPAIMHIENEFLKNKEKLNLNKILICLCEPIVNNIIPAPYNDKETTQIHQTIYKEISRRLYVQFKNSKDPIFCVYLDKPPYLNSNHNRHHLFQSTNVVLKDILIHTLKENSKEESKKKFNINDFEFVYFINSSKISFNTKYNVFSIDKYHNSQIEWITVSNCIRIESISNILSKQLFLNNLAVYNCDHSCIPSSLENQILSSIVPHSKSKCNIHSVKELCDFNFSIIVFNLHKLSDIQENHKKEEQEKEQEQYMDIGIDIVHNEDTSIVNTESINNILSLSTTESKKDSFQFADKSYFIKPIHCLNPQDIDNPQLFFTFNEDTNINSMVKEKWKIFLDSFFDKINNKNSEYLNPQENNPSFSVNEKKIFSSSFIDSLSNTIFQHTLSIQDKITTQIKEITLINNTIEDIKIISNSISSQQQQNIHQSFSSLVSSLRKILLSSIELKTKFDFIPRFYTFQKSNFCIFGDNMEKEEEFTLFTFLFLSHLSKTTQLSLPNSLSNNSECTLKENINDPLKYIRFILMFFNSSSFSIQGDSKNITHIIISNMIFFLLSHYHLFSHDSNSSNYLVNTCISHTLFIILFLVQFHSNKEN
jgi:hypothetical protein